MLLLALIILLVILLPVFYKLGALNSHESMLTKTLPNICQPKSVIPSVVTDPKCY
jgi:hypothetical protein